MGRAWLLVLLLLVPSVGTADEQERRVEQHKNAAHAAFELGKYDVAITEFQRAYSIRNDARLLYNIALAYLMRYRLEHAPADAVQARDLFRRFLLLAPSRGSPAEQERLLQELLRDPDIESLRY